MDAQAEYQHDQAAEVNDNGGLFGEEEEEDLDADDILGLDDDAGAAEQNQEGSLLMRFCPHDSSMLYPKVCFCWVGVLV